MVENHNFTKRECTHATLTPQGSGTITLNTSWNKLGYTRVGNKVHVHGNIIVSSVSSPVGTNIT